MREQGVALEDGVHLPLVRGQAGDVFPIKKDLAGIWSDEAPDGAQDRGLAAAGGAQQGDEFSVPNVQVEALEHLLPVVRNSDVSQRNDVVFHGGCIPFAAAPAAPKVVACLLLFTHNPALFVPLPFRKGMIRTGSLPQKRPPRAGRERATARDQCRFYEPGTLPCQAVFQMQTQ